MKCAYSQCPDFIETPQKCPKCKEVTYCCINCRTQDWYKGHQKACGLGKKNEKNRFEDLGEVLGTGSYGEVRLVKEKLTGKQFALKAINKISVGQDVDLNVIKREIAVQKDLNHPNIIKLESDFEDSEFIYMVLEYAENGSLFQEITEKERLSEDLARRYFIQIVGGISYLHDCQIVHRDIKPENILLDKDNNVKICDFGWSVKNEESRKTFCGTLDYMSPEMVLGQEYSYELDIWALGVLLYEILHGYSPFESAADTEKIQKIVNCRFKFDSAISENAKDLIQKMIQVKKETRIKLKDILSHPFFVGSQNLSNCLVNVGTCFRNYVANYGMDEGVVEEIKANECVVLFKKSGIREVVDINEIDRRIKRAKLVSKREGVEEEEKKKIEGGGKVLEMVRKLEGKDKGIEKDKGFERKKGEEFGSKVQKEIEKDGIEKAVGENKGIQERNAKNKGIGKGFDPDPRSERESPIRSEKVDRRDDEKSVGKKNNFVKTEIKNPSSAAKLEKAAVFKDSDSESEEDLVMKKFKEKFAKLVKEENNSVKQNPIEKPQESFENSFNSFEKPQESFENSFKSPKNFTKPPENQVFASAPSKFQFKSQLEDDQTSVTSKRLNEAELDSKISKISKEENIFSNLDSWIKAPIRKKRGANKKRPLEKPRDKSIDKTFEKFKEKFRDTPPPEAFPKEIKNSPQFKEKKEEIKNSPQFKEKKEEISSPNIYKLRILENMKKNEDSPEKSQEKAPIQKVSHENVFKFPAKKKGKLSGPSSPKFLSGSENESFVITEDIHEKACAIFNEKEIASVLKREKSLSPKPILKKKKSGSQSPLKKEKKKKVSINNKKLDYETQRELLEQRHEDFYTKLEKNWIEHDEVLEASDVSEHEVEMETKLNFEEYDHLLFNPPSVVSDIDGYERKIGMDNKRLQERKNELQAMILQVEKNNKAPIKVKKRKPKEKDGLLRWIGGLIGCSDRY